MSKRAADAQITKNSVGENNDSWGGGAPPKANAAQMANRKLAKPRGGRRHAGSARPSFGLGATSRSVQEQSFPPFGQSNGAQQGGFSFAQGSICNSQNQISQSFPPFNPPNNQNNSGTNTSFSAPTGAFSFNAPQTQNPFSSSYSAEGAMSQNGGFHGSIFNFNTPNKGNGNQTSGEGASLFATGAHNNANMANGTYEQAKTSVNGFTWPQTQQQTQSSNSLFSFSPAPQQQSQSVLASAADKAKEPMTNIFAGVQSPLAPENQNNSSKPDIYQQLTGAPPERSSTQPVSSPFGTNAAKSQESTKDKPFNFFGQTNQSSTNVFGTTPSTKESSHPNMFSPDAMQTSPDNTPQKAEDTSFKPFQFMTQPESQDKASPSKDTAAPLSDGSLFSRISAPNEPPLQKAAEPAASISPSASSSGSFFKPVSTPSSNPIFAPPAEVTPITCASELQSSNISSNVAAHAVKPFSFTASPARATEAPIQGTAQKAATANQTRQDQANTFGSAQVASASVLKQANTDQAASEELNEQDIGDPPKPPAHFTEEEKKQVTVGWRLKMLDTGMQEHLKRVSGPSDMDLLRSFYNMSKKAIMEAGGGPVPSLLPTKRPIAPDAEIDGAQAKKPKQNSAVSFTPLSSQTLSHSSPTLNQTSDVGLSQEPLSTSTKRKASEDISRDGGVSATNDSTKRNRGSDFTPKSQTSNLFSSIIDSKKASPEKGQKLSTETASGSTASASLGLFQANTPTTSNLFSSMAGGALQSPFQAKPNPSTKDLSANAFSLSKPNNSSETSSGLFQNLSNSTGSSPFKTAFNAPAKIEQQPAKVTAHQENDTKSASNPFAVKTIAPTGPSNSSSSPFKPDTQICQSSMSAIKPPAFSINPSSNFMAQFGDAAKKEAEAAKKKRKAEEYDSEEDDEAEWEKKDAERQQQKKQKIQEAAKTAQQFVPTFSAKPTPQASHTKISKSIFDSIHPAFNNNAQHNIFGHVAKRGPGSDVDTDAETHDEGKEADEPFPRNLEKERQSAGRSLFDRISRPGEGSPPSKATEHASEESPSADHTWKVDSPIKFGATSASSSGPLPSVTANTPSKPPVTGLFGAPTATPEKPIGSGSNLFGNLVPPSTGTSPLGFGFGPAKSTTSVLSQQSNSTSRATSPGATTGESATESATEAVEDSTQHQEQLDLMSQRAGEEDEDVLYEVRAKALQFNSSEKIYLSKGVGPLRVLKHRETGKRRTVMRVDPSGTVVINSGFVKSGKYESIGCNTVRCGLADQSGQLAMWHLRVKTNDLATELAQILNESKEFGS